MKIAIHVEQLDHRGCGTVTYDYSAGIRDCLGYEPVIISSGPKSTCPISKYSEFKTILYDSDMDIPSIVDKEKIDVFYAAKGGLIGECPSPSSLPKNCKTSIHCVFNMSEPHGDRYAGVSEWLAGKYNNNSWVPHIINLPKTEDTLHDELSIPRDAFVVGRLGGYEQFDIHFVKQTLVDVINSRQDMWAIFLNTRQFIDHPKIKFLPFTASNLYKTKFINTADMMLHARSDGETFGLAIGEFSSKNKPIFTFDAAYPQYARAHIHILGEKAILYKNPQELFAYLLQIDKNYVKNVEWDCYSERFSPQNVMKQFNEVFIK